MVGDGSLIRVVAAAGGSVSIAYWLQKSGHIKQINEETHMALTEQEQKTLDFCKQVRTAEQVSDHLGVIINSAYKPLRSLQRLGLLEKRSQQPNMKASYLATDLAGRSIADHLDELVASSDGYIQHTGVQAHNPFNL